MINSGDSGGETDDGMCERRRGVGGGAAEKPGTNATEVRLSVQFVLMVSMSKCSDLIQEWPI